MNLFLRVLSIGIVSLLAAQVVSCTNFTDDDEEAPVVVLVSATPQDGEIPANGTITLNFDNALEDVTVRASTGKIGKTIITGKTVTINGPFVKGEFALTITWADGEQTLNYTVTDPDPALSTETEKIVNEPAPKPQPTKSPFNVTDANFSQSVMESELPVVVYFWADWCPPCKWMAPIIKEVASENQETFLIAKLDTDRNRQTVQKYRIEAIPTFIVFKDGKITGRFVGGMQKAPLVQRIRQAIN